MKVLNKENKSLISEIYVSLHSKGLIEFGQLFEDSLELYDTCCKFVEEKCKGRDESHGYHHMVTVTKNALTILKELIDSQNVHTYYDLNDVIAGAMLHDVADYKYDDENRTLEKSVIEFMTILTHKFKVHSKMWNLIDNVSFSKERKALGYENLCQQKKLVLPIRLHTVRHIIADADRLEAIGEIGATRCIEYGRHANIGISEEELKKKVMDHAKEKLYLLPFPVELGDNKEYRYIRTLPGIKMAEKLDQDTVKYVEEFCL